MSDSVLVVYNLPVCPSNDQGPSFAESDAGVLDEVHAVMKALDRLSVSARSVGIAGLNELTQLLYAANETIVFNLVESLPKRPLDATFVPTICQAYAKACTGSDTPSLLVTADKIRTKTNGTALDNRPV